MATTEELNDDLLDDDLDGEEGGDGSNQTTDQTPAVKVGDQEDGGVIVELDENDSKEKAEGEEEGKPTEDAALEEKRKQRREERAEQKRRRQEKDERIRRELESERKARRELENRLAVIERRSEGSEAAQLEESIKTTAQAYNYQKARLTTAQADGNAAEATDALEKMMTLRQKHDQLTNIKTAYQQRQQQPQPLDVRVKTNAEQFLQRNAWYKPEGTDPDSMVTRTLDNSLVAEGFDPRNPEYWDELQSRIKKYLPHRVAGGKVSQTETSGQRDTKPKSVVAGSGRDSAASVGAKATFKLSADRVQAMKEAGVWDDPKAREEAIKRYRTYDKENGKA